MTCGQQCTGDESLLVQNSVQTDALAVQVSFQHVHLPEKDIVTLVVEGHSSPALEVGILTKYGGKHAPQPVPQPGPEVV